ncbi:MAG: hypothetical protein QM758_19080 [Armatimonas sp.]
MNMRPLFLTLSLLALCTVAHAAPALNSRPNAAYTLYLNFDGFSYTGTWGNTGKTPGNVPAYTGNDTQLREIWARTAEKYAAFDVNVTTVDPAIAAGQAGSALARQNYYDNTPRVMHTVIGGSNGWYGGGGGVSYVGVASGSFPGGYKTNWVFPANLGFSPKIIAEASAHEIGHAFGLDHQGDNTGNTGQSNEYSSNGGSVGNGSYAPIMGNSYSSQRGAWRVGTTSTTTTVQNDVQTIFSNNGMSLINDGVGKSFATATALPMAGPVVDSAAALAGGVIMPTSGSSADPIGINNYTKNYYRFSLGASSLISLTVNSGADWITPGTVAVGGTLRSRLNIYSAGNLISALGVGTEAIDTLSTTFSGTLAAGDYFAEITSFGGFPSAFDSTARYYDMGSYTLSGSGFAPVAAPEPGTISLLLLPGLGLLIRRRRVTGPSVGSLAR